MSISRKLGLVLFAVSALLSSCEGGFDVEGHVHDKVTNKPVEKVRVIMIIGDNDTLWKTRPVNPGQTDITDPDSYKDSYTDINGHFVANSMLVSCSPHCPDYKLLFIKDGYKPLTVQAKDSNDWNNILMERVQ
jgi:hypothetical protein